MTKKKTKILCIFDGFGLLPNSENNCIARAKMPNFRRLLRDYWWSSLNADGESVGQETGLVGNSEVGHMNIGGLKLVPQLSYQITKSSESGFNIPPAPLKPPFSASLKGTHTGGEENYAPDQLFNPTEFLREKWENEFEVKVVDYSIFAKKKLTNFKYFWQDLFGQDWDLLFDTANTGDLNTILNNFADSYSHLHDREIKYSVDYLKSTILAEFELALEYYSDKLESILSDLKLSIEPKEMGCNNHTDLVKRVFVELKKITNYQVQTTEKNKTIHLIGLFSTGTIHSDMRHWVGAVESALKAGAEKIVLHLITDGRDSDKKSLVATWEKFEIMLEERINKNSPREGCQPQVDGVISPNKQYQQLYLETNKSTFTQTQKTIKYKSLPFNPELKEKAKQLRKAGVLSEVILWNIIKNKQLNNLDFERQKIIGNYIVDFYCPELDLVIEIDGESHDFKGQYDENREKYLHSLNLEILHFEDIRIKKDLDNVRQELVDYCSLKKTSPRQALPDTPQEGNYLAQNKLETQEDNSKNWQAKIFLGSIGGRFYAMDRDNNWERVFTGLLPMLNLNILHEDLKSSIFKANQKTADTLEKYSLTEERVKDMIEYETTSHIEKYNNPSFDNLYKIGLSIKSVAEVSYKQEKFDEYIKPTYLSNNIVQNDTVWLINFRTDRMKQFTTMLCDINKEFELNLTILAMNDYGDGNALEIERAKSKKQSNAQNSPFEKRGTTAGGGVFKPYPELPYNAALKEKAKELRKAGVLSEVLVWNKIKDKQLLDLDFTRQQVIGNYIVDFYCPKLALVIEVDGSSHDNKGEYDEVREKYLKSLGLEILHYADLEVKKSLDEIMGGIYNFCKQRLDLLGGNEYLVNEENTPPADAGTPFEKGEFGVVFNGGMETINQTGYYPIFKSQPVQGTLAEVISKNSKTQLHIAETEKYNHVTYFLNGGQDKKWTGEDWIVIDSNKVASHAEKPEMKAKEVTDKILEVLDYPPAPLTGGKKESYDYIIVNYANPDMIGHTGDIEAGIQSMEFLDEQLGRLLEVIERDGHEMIIIADHGNMEFVGSFEQDGKQLTDTEHNADPVPFIIVSEKFRVKNNRDYLAQPKITLEGCIKLDLPASKILKQIVELSLEIADNEIANLNQDPITTKLLLSDYLNNYLNTWYYFNNLELEALEEQINKNYFDPNGDEYNKVKYELTKNLIAICREIGAKYDCFELLEYFEKEFIKQNDIDTLLTNTKSKFLQNLTKLQENGYANPDLELIAKVLEQRNQVDLTDQNTWLTQEQIDKTEENQLPLWYAGVFLLGL